MAKKLGGKMKKLLLALLFAPLLMAQYIPVVNTSTQLSAFEGTGLCILNAPDATGGVYTFIDSTYSEGTYAYDHIYSGKQWAKLGYAVNMSTSGTLAVTGAVTFSSTAEINGNITLENDEIVANSTDGDLIFTFNEDDDSLGQLILRSSIAGTAVAPNDHIDITFEAKDGGSTNTEYAKIIMTVADTASASEDATIKFQTITNATSTLGMTITGSAVAVAGALTASSITATSTGATIITGSVTATDSTTSAILKDSVGKKWKLKINTEGVISADSTGLN